MQLQTKVPILPQDSKIEYHSNIVLLGSCFAEEMGQQLESAKFKNTINPFGIIFNPLVLNRLINIATLYSRKGNIPKERNAVFEYNNYWHSFNAHSSLSAASKQEALHNLNVATQTLLLSIKEASHVIITLGTAWGYIEKTSKKVVANCHKMPQQNFSKTLASVSEIQDALQAIVSNIVDINTSATVLFTVSPVRHIKDGFIENTQSKSHLITAVHQTIKNSKQCSYFPSYEIMMDQLRDYRFYKEDMLHPNRLAINYIWQRFIETWMSSKTVATIKKVEEIQRGLAHKPFNSSSKAHQEFLRVLQNKIEKLQSELPDIKF